MTSVFEDDFQDIDYNDDSFESLNSKKSSALKATKSEMKEMAAIADALSKFTVEM